MNSVPSDNKTVARTLAAAFGGNPSVRKYWDDNHNSDVDILMCVDAPEAGVDCFATIGLSDHVLMQGSDVYPARIEILGACSSETNQFGNIVATCAFCVINDHWFAAPGVIFRNIVAMYAVSKFLKHIAFFPPFLWGDKLPSLQLGSKTVNWLLAVPISDKEYELARDTSFDRLEDAFVREQIDIFDIDRASVV